MVTLIIHEGSAGRPVAENLFHLIISIVFHIRIGRKEESLFFSYVPISWIDPRSLPRVVIDEVHLPVEVMGDIPTVRKRYLPIPSPGHISLRSKSIQNPSLSLFLYRRAVAVDGRISVRAGASARFSSRIYGTQAT